MYSRILGVFGMLALAAASIAGAEDPVAAGLKELTVGEGAGAFMVLIPTPVEIPEELPPVFFEARENRLFAIPLDEIERRAGEAFRSAVEASQGRSDLLVEKLESAGFDTEAHRVDLSFALISQIALNPRDDAAGCDISALQGESAPACLSDLVKELDPQRDRVVLLIRGAQRPEHEKAAAFLKSLGFAVETRTIPAEGPLRLPMALGPPT